MSIQAPPRGAILGRSYLGEDEADRLIRDLRDTVMLCNHFLQQVPAPSLLAGRITRAEKSLLHVVRELKDALGSSADE